MAKPQQRPEGKLIASALLRAGLSQRKAAELIGLSEGRLRQVISGYQSIGRGLTADVFVPAETLARIAFRLGISADQLRSADRADAAEWLDNLQLQPTPGPLLESSMALAELREWIDAESPESDFPPTNALYIWHDSQLLQELADRLEVRRQQVIVERSGSPAGPKGRFEVVFRSTTDATQWFDDHVKPEPHREEGGRDDGTTEAEKSDRLEEVTETVDFQDVELPQQVPDQ